MKCCPSCGQTLPRDVPVPTLREGTIQYRLFEMVRKAGQYGIYTDAIHERLYQECENGGPGVHTVSANVVYLNRKLKPVGLRVTTKGRGGRGGRWHYYLVSL